MSNGIGGTVFFRLAGAVFTVGWDNWHDHFCDISPHLKNIGTGIRTETTGNTEICIDKNFHIFLRKKNEYLGQLFIIIQREKRKINLNIEELLKNYLPVFIGITFRKFLPRNLPEESKSKA